MSKNIATDRTDLKLSENVLKLADAIKADIKIGAGGVAEKLDKTFFEKNLPENITMADVKRVDAFRSDLITATGLALGEAGLEAMKKDKTLAAVSLEFGSNKDKVTMQMDRMRTYPNRMGGPDAPDIVRYGNISARYQVAAAGNRGDFAKLRAHLGANAAKLFS